MKNEPRHTSTFNLDNGVGAKCMEKAMALHLQMKDLSKDEVSTTTLMFAAITELMIDLDFEKTYHINKEDMKRITKKAMRVMHNSFKHMETDDDSKEETE